MLSVLYILNGEHVHDEAIFTSIL